jgi:short-subunit dehydrogenase
LSKAATRRTFFGVKTHWALITGASSGIGLEFARLAAIRRNNLILVARNEAKLREVANELQAAHGCQVQIIASDLSRVGAAGDVFARATADQKFVSTLVNNAGFGSDGFFVDSDFGETSAMVQTNVTSVAELCHCFVRPMLKMKQGKILNVASTAAFQPGPKMSVYYASKAFVFSFSNALANELQGTGVTVTTLCPGPTRTEFHQRAGTNRSGAVAKWMMSADAVARAGWSGMERGNRNVVPGLLNKVGVALARIAPTRVSAAVARKVIEG